MHIQTRQTRKSYPSRTQRRAATEQTAIAEDFVSLTKSSALLLGGLGLLGTAVRTLGPETGLLAGAAGVLAGASVGGSVATVLAGERTKTGMLLGAAAGGMLGTYLGNTGAAEGLVLASLALPFGLVLLGAAIETEQISEHQPETSNRDLYWRFRDMPIQE